MRERPILFSGPMVKAILEGRKTQTRRIVKQKQMYEFNAAISIGECSNFLENKKHEWDDAYLQDFCPHGRVGDQLWVRETWCPHGDYDSIKPSEITGCSKVYYRADKELDVSKWRPSIFMPRWASRITLEITGVRVERLQDISEEDAKAEGVEKVNQCEILRCCGYKDYGVERGGFMSATRSFRSLWDRINADRAPWEENPLVWAIEFKEVK